MLDRPGLARVMSLPPGADTLSSPYLKSYRVPQGILHNPKSDRRTTQGIFHIVEGGLPVPADKLAVPKKAFAALLAAALQPPPDDLWRCRSPAIRTTVPVCLFRCCCGRSFVRPPEPIPGKTMEIRFFAPGQPGEQSGFRGRHFRQRRRSVPAGKRRRARRDALDRAHRLRDPGAASGGHEEKGSGPAALRARPPNASAATACAGAIDELYNGGGAFKLACRDERGVMVTIIADNYYGYCKKEVKTQISFAANLSACARRSTPAARSPSPPTCWGRSFTPAAPVSLKKARFDRSHATAWADRSSASRKATPWTGAIRTFFYVPEDAEFSVREGTVALAERAAARAAAHAARATRPTCCPSGFRLRMEKQSAARPGGWSARARAARCATSPAPFPAAANRKFRSPSPTSILEGPGVRRRLSPRHGPGGGDPEEGFLATFTRIAPPDERAQRPILSPERTLGSVIQLLTPSPEYTDEHNAWLATLPQTIRQLSSP